MRLILKPNLLRAILCCGVIGSVAVAEAALAPLDDNALEQISGQAMMEVVTLRDPGQSGGGNNDIAMKFMRIRTGAKIEINANIDKVIAGEYARDDKYTSYSQNFAGNKKNYRSPVFHGNDKDNVTSAKCTGTSGSNGSNYATSGCYIPGSDVTPTGADVLIENLSLGAVINDQLQSMIMEDPYIEIVFADQNYGTTKKGDIIGLRFGAENQNGHLGNYSQHGLGTEGICSTDPTACKGLKPDSGERNREGGVLSFSGNLNLIAGSTALIGWSLIEGVARTNYTPVKDGLLGGLQLLPGNSTQTLADVDHKNTQEFFLSFASREIQYPNISNTEDFKRMRLGTASKPQKTIPGVALNMVDGIGLTLPQALHTLSGGVPKFSNCFGGKKDQCTP